VALDDPATEDADGAEDGGAEVSDVAGADVGAGAVAGGCVAWAGGGGAPLCPAGGTGGLAAGCWGCWGCCAPGRTGAMRGGGLLASVLFLENDQPSKLPGGGLWFVTPSSLDFHAPPLVAYQ
jgi:hypothetical protein